jgi:hypothetical protein
MHRWIVAAFVMVMTVAAASAQTLYLPAAANADGVNQTRWLTDLEIKAEGEEGATFVVELLESYQNNNDPLSVDGTVGPGECRRLANVLEAEFGFSGTAALRVTATSGRIIANSRTFNDDPGGTYGQTVPAVDVDRATGFGTHATLIQLSRSADPSLGFRTNIGVVNTVGEQNSIEIDIHAADGTLLGTITRTLKPFEHRQFNDVFATVGADEIGDGYALVRTTSENGSFITYASVVDNKSGDAVFILGATDDVTAPQQERLVVFESFMRPG